MKLDETKFAADLSQLLDRARHRIRSADELGIALAQEEQTLVRLASQLESTERSRAALFAVVETYHAQVERMSPMDFKTAAPRKLNSA